MEKNISIISNINEYRIDELIELIHLSFEERTNQGLLFKYRKISKSELLTYCHQKLLLSYEIDNNIAGVIFFNIKGNICLMGIVATHPSYKRHGIATSLYEKLEKYCLSKRIDFIYSDTATKAKSSVLWHEKMGLKKYKMTSFPSTNYYSWEFVKDIKNPNRNFIKRNIHLILSSIKCLLCWDKNGKLTRIGKIFN